MSEIGYEVLFAVVATGFFFAIGYWVLGPLLAKRRRD